MNKINSKPDFSIIRTVNVPNEQFKAIQKKAEYIMLTNRDNGEVLMFKRERKAIE